MAQQKDIWGFLDYRKRHPEYEPSEGAVKALENRANARVNQAHGDPPEGWSDWAYRIARETPGAVSDFFSTDMTPEEQMRDFAKTLPGAAANTVEGTAGTLGDMSDTKWGIVDAINSWFQDNTPTNLDMGMDLARARNMTKGDYWGAEDFRNNVTRPLIGNSVGYRPKSPGGQILDVASQAIGVEDAIPMGLASKGARLLKKGLR